MELILILSGSFLVFIVSLIVAQMCFFGQRWKLFCVAVLAALVSGACIFVEGYPCCLPEPDSVLHHFQNSEPM